MYSSRILVLFIVLTVNLLAFFLLLFFNDRLQLNNDDISDHLDCPELFDWLQLLPFDKDLPSCLATFDKLLPFFHWILNFLLDFLKSVFKIDMDFRQYAGSDFYWNLRFDRFLNHFFWFSSFFLFAGRFLRGRSNLFFLFFLKYLQTLCIILC